MTVWTRFGLPLTALGAIGFGAAVIPACSSKSPAGPGNDAGPPVVGNYCGNAGDPCCAGPGQAPNPECDDGDETACKATPGCHIASSCGNTSTCMPLADNSASDVKTFRMRRIVLVAPSTLANQTIQNTVVTSGVDMLEPQCAEKGTGDFSWIISLNTKTNVAVTGGAPPCDLTGTPSCDPFHTGYCFVNKQIGSLAVAPITVPVTKGADGTYSTATGAIPTLNVPIYFQGSIIVLPINGGAVEGVKLSDSGNCIGSFNSGALQPDCSDNYQNCSKWKTDASLTGYITLKQAEGVQVKLLNETLCAILTQKLDPASRGCPKDAAGNITAKGDFCSTTATAGGCQDSVWLAATFAGSAVKLDATGASQPDCTGGGAPVDAGTPADAGGD